MHEIGKLNTNSPPPVPAWFQAGFHAFLGSYLRRHFHSVSVQRDGFPPRGIVPEMPLIIYANHPSWWDPLIAHFLNKHLLAGRQFYAPIDSRALEQYRVFAKLGFFGVTLETVSGAASFLKQSLAILSHPSTSLWITPEGRFCDPRDRSAGLMPGLAHLCSRLGTGVVVPLAIEYTFWEERLPECLFRFGTPILIGSERGRDREPGGDKVQWSRCLGEELRLTQDRLADAVIARDAAEFLPILRGRRGAGGSYDLMRRLKTLTSGKSFRPDHGEKLK